MSEYVANGNITTSLFWGMWTITHSKQECSEHNNTWIDYINWNGKSENAYNHAVGVIFDTLIKGIFPDGRMNRHKSTEVSVWSVK